MPYARLTLLLLFAGTALGTMTAALPTNAFAQQPALVLPLSSEAGAPRIDGVWTSPGEWSRASEVLVNYTDGTQLAVRGMHDGSSLYVLLEMPEDNVVDGHAAVCFDTLGDGGPYMNPDDYCYVLGDILLEYQGDGRTTLLQGGEMNFDADAARGLSGYSSPHHRPDGDHVTYEFKVPAEQLGVSSGKDGYGFYVTYDTRGESNSYQYYYSWPETKNAAYLRVSPPRAWASLSVSSDAQVPEFPFSLLVSSAAIAGIVGYFSIAKKSRK